MTYTPAELLIFDIEDTKEKITFIKNTEMRMVNPDYLVL